MELSILYITILSVMGVVMAPIPTKNELADFAVRTAMLVAFLFAIQFAGLHV